MSATSDSDILAYLRAANTNADDGPPDIRLAIVTNFTDDVLKKLLIGMCRSNGITPEVYAVPFKQYLFALKDASAKLQTFQADLTFIFFDSNPYAPAEFASETHAADVVADIAAYARRASGLTIVHTLPPIATRQHGRLLKDSDLKAAAAVFDQGIRTLAREISTVSVIDTGIFAQRTGEIPMRDMRGTYAFSQPFTHAFLLAVAEEWMAFVRARRGLMRKCIVLDLDNTLWGGIVGEVGPHGVQLGHEYPGNAYRAFQSTLKELSERGIILAIASRNNEADVDELFADNAYTVLKPEDFAARRVNWEPKTDNLRSLAKELNIGLDSFIFIDDDPVNRAAVRAELPEVLVPEWNFPPEEYVRALLELDAFHALRITDEDRKRSEMYAAEAKRKATATKAQSPEEYLSSLGIAMNISVNNEALVPRIAQLTQKTNQYNLTTVRASEADIKQWIAEGALVYTADVRDTFGSYGITALAILRPGSKKTVGLHTLLMSCRVAGRHVEDSFFAAITEDLARRGYKTLAAQYIPTAKNAPVKDFLSSVGAKEKKRTQDGTISYEVALGKGAGSRHFPVAVHMVP